MISSSFREPGAGSVVTDPHPDLRSSQVLSHLHLDARSRHLARFERVDGRLQHLAKGGCQLAGVGPDAAHAIELDGQADSPALQPLALLCKGLLEDVGDVEDGPFRRSSLGGPAVRVAEALRIGKSLFGESDVYRRVRVVTHAFEQLLGFRAFTLAAAAAVGESGAVVCAARAARARAWSSAPSAWGATCRREYRLHSLIPQQIATTTPTGRTIQSKSRVIPR